MKYGKIIEGNLVFAPSKLTDGDNVVYNPNAEMLLRHGYFPIKFTNPPVTDDDHMAVSKWEQTDVEILQQWEVVEKDEEDTAE